MRKIYLAIILLLCVTGCLKETLDSRMDVTDIRKNVADIRKDVVDSRIVGQWQTDGGGYITILSDGTCDYYGKAANVKNEGDIIIVTVRGDSCTTYRILEVTETLMRWGYRSNGEQREKVFKLVPDPIR